MSDDLVYRLRKRAEIRRQIPSRKSVQEGKPDRIADLLEEAANHIDMHQMSTQSEKEAWRYASELEEDRKKLMLILRETLVVLECEFNHEDDYLAWKHPRILEAKNMLRYHSRSNK
jgi:hypothetical protein